MALKDKIKIIARKLYSDDRGWFLKVIDGHEENLPKSTGEIYLTNAKPGQTKGGHYHIQAVEWFTLVNGSCDLHLVDIESGENLVIKLDASLPKTVFVPSKIAHSFLNTSDSEFLLVAYTNILYDPLDTVPYEFNF